MGESFAVGCLMLSSNADICSQQMAFVEQFIGKQLSVIGWRDVPINADHLGEIALKQLPNIKHLYIANNGNSVELFKAKLMVLRKQISYSIADTIKDKFYIVSFSADTIVYKGLMMPEQLSKFYLDLNNSELKTKICIFHQRFSTNTLPKWQLAQPFRFLAHNGEINTIIGNRNWAMARAELLTSSLITQAIGSNDLSSISPIVNLTGSDSSSLDNMLEYLCISGLDVHRAIRLLMPPAWKNKHQVSYKLRAFFEFNAMHSEPWDGPAGIVICDGPRAICSLDRNGLRPSRWSKTKDLLIVASETGLLDVEDEILEKGKLGPGELISVNTETGEILNTKQIDERLCSDLPYVDWLNKLSIRIKAQVDDEPGNNYFDKATLDRLMKLFGTTYEEYHQVILPMAINGKESVGSMGDDTPIAVLSKQNRPIYDYFRQQFAQVTNPPIDPLRESIAMSLETIIGREHNIFKQEQIEEKRIVINSPILSSAKFNKLQSLSKQGYQLVKLSLGYNPNSQSLKKFLQELLIKTSEIAKRKNVIIILSDKNLQPEEIPAQALLAIGAVHQNLSIKGLRCRVNLIVETGSAKDPHHFACLIGYGATAVYPYLSYSIINLMQETGHIKSSIADAQLNFRKSINKGLLKILSKMGISTIASYRGAQLFEALGIDEEVMRICFSGTISRIGGRDFDYFQNQQRQLNKLANNPNRPLPPGGVLKFVSDSEYHAYNPDVVISLHKAVRTNSYLEWKQHSAIVNNRQTAVLRDLFKLKKAQPELEIGAVEAIAKITRRFNSAAMSLGALSPEAHMALANALNSIGGLSNSGEGGEDPARYNTIDNSGIKQVASGRFGVTANYLVSAKIIQIKIAQGAKPGEGGQLPGIKVNKLIARLRYSTPGVTLISPPPHHDIYSIEDLAQLIYDLKEVNSEAKVSVKLVSRPGIGTIACGVAKAGADMITISGYDGGTAASPVSSIRYAGSPWELGLAEVQQMLQVNNLRDKVIVQVDGGLKTGLDVIKAAILGAESFGFGSGPMIALGCKYLRICHLNNCATGVATQNEELRKEHYRGSVEDAKNYFNFIAEEVRELLAKLGFASLESIIGKVDLLKFDAQLISVKNTNIDLEKLLHQDSELSSKPRFSQTKNDLAVQSRTLALSIFADCQSAINRDQSCSFNYSIANYDRTIGANIAGHIAKKYGEQGLPNANINLNFTGVAGQSFGAWNVNGINLYLVGEANDYVAKGMSGGKIIIKPPTTAKFVAKDSNIIGNTVLYGATGGKLMASGRAGERFAVRNSGAIAIIEGAGDHCCEIYDRRCCFDIRLKLV